MPTGAEGAGIVVIVHDHRMELDLSRLRNPPEQQSVLAHRPEDGSGGRYHACSGDLRARTRRHPIRAAGLGPPVEHALVSLLVLNGLRVSKARRVLVQRVVRSTADRASRAAGTRE